MRRSNDVQVCVLCLILHRCLGLILPAAIGALIPWPAGGASVEDSLEMDGAGRISNFLIVRMTDASWSLAYRIDPEHSDLFLASANGSWFSFGRMGDAGLAAEVRNPGYKSLSRLNERTFFRADLRSLSQVSYGISAHSPDDRFGVVCDTGKTGVRFVVYCVPVSSEKWCFENLVQFATHPEPEPDESWYPQGDTDPGGCIFTPAVRLRYLPGKLNLGLTVQVSAGPRLQPGLLSALACTFASGPLKIRARCTVASDYFRSASRNLLRIPVGGSSDLRYRPSEGLQFSAAVALGAVDSPGVISVPEGFIWSAETALGWKWQKLAIWCESDWKGIEVLPDMIGFGISVFHKRSFASLEVRKADTGSWELKLEGYWPIQDVFFLHGGLKAAGLNPADETLLGTKLRLRLLFGKSSLILNLEADDLLRDWNPLPTGVGDFSASITYKRSFSE